MVLVLVVSVIHVIKVVFNIKQYRVLQIIIMNRSSRVSWDLYISISQTHLDVVVVVGANP